MTEPPHAAYERWPELAAMAAPVTLAGDQCEVHGSHRPPVLETQVHHIQPTYMGGPDTPVNKVRICGTGHESVHVLIRALVAGKPLPKAALADLKLARRGYDAWVMAGKPGRPE